ncbi:D-beta-hydroxybutyrate dehydrogenase, mitochondrial isoform X1 [Cherax quadricarinatus]
MLQTKRILAYLKTVVDKRSRPKMFLTYDRISRVLLCGLLSVVPGALLHALGVFSCCAGFLVTWFFSSAIYLALATLKVTPSGKAVLITGCDTGFGHALALHLHKQGFKVLAGCLDENGEGAERLRHSKSSNRLHVVQMDISSQEQLAKALKKVKSLLRPKEVLWGLVNNAAINTHGAVEWVAIDTYRKICNVNLFGTIAVTKTFLPLIRQARGRVVNIGSVRGRLPTPLGSAYDIAKYGIEGFNADLRNEMRRFGVNVSLIEPGNYTAGTNILTARDVHHYEKSMWAEMDQEVKDAYGKDFFDQAIQFHLSCACSGNPDVSEVIYAMTEALTQQFPQSRYQPMDIFLYLMVFISQHFPEWVYDYLFIEFLFKKGF